MSKQLSPAMPAETSNALLTNLRLLDFDKRPDWPSITPQIFSANDAQHTQKNRVRSVEWILYRLFGEWDPEETKNVSPTADGAPSTTKNICPCTEAPTVLSSTSTPSITQSSCSTLPQP